MTCSSSYSQSTHRTWAWAWKRSTDQPQWQKRCSDSSSAPLLATQAALGCSALFPVHQLPHQVNGATVLAEWDALLCLFKEGEDKSRTESYHISSQIPKRVDSSVPSPFAKHRGAVRPQRFMQFLKYIIHMMILCLESSHSHRKAEFPGPPTASRRGNRNVQK